jgi:signal transduction histidine kinase
MNLFKKFSNVLGLSAGILSAALASLIVLSIIFYNRFNSFVRFSEQTARTYSVIDQIERAESILKDVETGTRGFIITRDTSFLRPLFNARALLKPALDSLKDLVADNAQQVNDFNELQHLASLKLNLSESAKTFSMFNDLQKDSLYIAMVYSKGVMDQFRSVAKHMVNRETDLLAFRKKQMEYFKSKVPRNFTVIFISALVTSLAFGIWTFVELRKRIMYQSSLEEHIVQLNQNNAELEQIAFAASHDLQEPIRKIRIFSERLKNASPGEFRESAPGVIDKINRFAVRLHGLIADLSNLIDAVRTHPERQLVSLSEVVEDVEKQFDEQIAATGCRIIQSDLPAVEGSPEQLKTIFVNLLSNSLHFAAPARKPVIIIAADVVNGDRIAGLPKQLSSKTYDHVKFQDNGIGFDQQFRDKLFMPFQRLHNDTRNETKRKGMGLAICKRIMVNLGGWIDAEGHAEKGTAIHLYFPSRPTEPASEAEEKA